MSNKISNTDPGGSFQDALPRPNLETLKTILRCHGCPEAFVDPFAEGYVPREFKLGTTQFWKIRDAFYLLAKDAVSRLNGRVPFVQGNSETGFAVNRLVVFCYHNSEQVKPVLGF